MSRTGMPAPGMPVSDRQGLPASHRQCQSGVPAISTKYFPPAPLLRFLSIFKAPFTLEYFVQSTGIPLHTALLTLSHGCDAGLLRIIQPSPHPEFSVYLAVPPNRPKYKDFTPSSTKLQAILNAMLPGKPYLPDSLLPGSGMGLRTIQRYLQYLAVLGCLSRSSLPATKKPLTVYQKTGRPLPARLPRYFITCSPAWNACAPGMPVPGMPVSDRQGLPASGWHSGSDILSLAAPIPPDKELP